MLQYFCGGPLNGRVLSFAEITQPGPENQIPINDYRWTHVSINSGISDEVAQVWTWLRVDDPDTLPPIRYGFISWEYAMTLVETVWRKADRAFARLAEINARTNTLELDLDRERTRERLNTFCEVLAIFMPPHFRTAREVAAELQRRYEAKMGDQAYETKGLGGRSLELERSETPKKVTTPTAAKSAADSMSAEDKAAIKSGFSMGFSKAELSKTWGVGLGVIEQVISG